MRKPATTKDAFKMCINAVRALKKPVIVVLDEFDQLDVTMNSNSMISMFWSLAGQGKLIMVTMANSLDLSAKNEADVYGKVSHLGFPRYTSKQLRLILEARAKLLRLDMSIFDPVAINLLLTKISSSSGDCRRVLDCCTQSILDSKSDKVSFQDAREVMQAALPSEMVNDTGAIVHGLDFASQVVLYSFCTRLHQADPKDAIATKEKKESAPRADAHLSKEGMTTRDIILRWQENMKSHKKLKSDRVADIEETVTESKMVLFLDCLVDTGLIEKITPISRRKIVPSRYKLIHQMSEIKAKVEDEWKKLFAITTKK